MHKRYSHVSFLSILCSPIPEGFLQRPRSLRWCLERPDQFDCGWPRCSPTTWYQSTRGWPCLPYCSGKQRGLELVSSWPGICCKSFVLRVGDLWNPNFCSNTWKCRVFYHYLPHLDCFPSKVSSANLERSYRRAPRGAKEGEAAPAGICHLCVAGMPGPGLEWELPYLILEFQSSFIQFCLDQTFLLTRYRCFS